MFLQLKCVTRFRTRLAIAICSAFACLTPAAPPYSQDAAAPQIGTARQADIGGAVSLELVYIPPGDFLMGSTPEEKAWATGIEGGAQAGTERESYEGERPRPMRVNDAFWMGRTEVSVGQFRRFAEETKYVTDAEKPGGKTQCFNPKWNGYHLTTQVTHPW